METGPYLKVNQKKKKKSSLEKIEFREFRKSGGGGGIRGKCVVNAVEISRSLTGGVDPSSNIGKGILAGTLHTISGSVGIRCLSINTAWQKYIRWGGGGGEWRKSNSTQKYTRSYLVPRFHWGQWESIHRRRILRLSNQEYLDQTKQELNTLKNPKLNLKI